MAENFIILRPTGSGYTLVPTQRSDSPMCSVRYIFNTPAFGPFVYVTNMRVADWCACVCGWDLNNPGGQITAIKMREGTQFWELTCFFPQPTGPGWCVDITFTSHAFCKELTEVTVP